MPAPPPVSAAFLADLEIACPTCAGAVADTFLTDLDHVYPAARSANQHQREVATADLISLEESLTSWRDHNQRLLSDYLARLPADDPLLNPVSLFGTLDYGRLETAHTRALAWLLGDREHGFGFRLLEALLAHLGLGTGKVARAGWEVRFQSAPGTPRATPGGSTSSQKATSSRTAMGARGCS